MTTATGGKTATPATGSGGASAAQAPSSANAGSGVPRELESLTVNITQEIHVRASVATTFEALLQEMGPGNRGQHEVSMPMTLEAWPGGRWFRDLGDGNGHLWGHVQAIKRPTLIEIAGPLMMSFAVASNVQYRLKESEGGTLITLRHTALGLFPPDGYREALGQGWTLIFDRLRRRFDNA
ncbi:MAG: SRPBCC domain-containing protein [Thermoanaerobaculia bacterium]